MSMIRNIETSLQNQKVIDARINATDELIHESVDQKKKKFISDIIKNKEKEENQKVFLVL